MMVSPLLSLNVFSENVNITCEWWLKTSIDYILFERLPLHTSNL